MLQLLLKSHLAFLLIPLITLAIEPSDPTSLCDRFLGEKDKAQCVAKISHGEFDWYAASTCSQQQEDKAFLNCLDEVKNATFNPQALELCAKSADLSDEARISCIQKVKNKDYTRAQLKKCAESKSAAAIELCLATSAKPRAPASATAPSGFQALEINK